MAQAIMRRVFKNAKSKKSVCGEEAHWNWRLLPHEAHLNNDEK